MPSTSDTGRSPFREVVDWALPELAGYVLAALGAVLAFTVWAVVYTYIWPGPPPPAVIEQPPTTTPAVVPPRAVPPPTENGPAVAQPSPADTLPIAQLKQLAVYDANNVRIGKIEDVLVNPEGKVVFFIVGIGGGFLGGQGKDIAVPPQDVQFKKNDDSTWKPVLGMSKDAVKNAPKYTFDPAATKWVPVPQAAPSTFEPVPAR
jgi:sporulation protein YlmC with PRC-barrel domain